VIFGTPALFRAPVVTGRCFDHGEYKVIILIGRVGTITIVLGGGRGESLNKLRELFGLFLLGFQKVDNGLLSGGFGFGLGRCFLWQLVCLGAFAAARFVGAGVAGAEVGFFELQSNGWVVFKGLGNRTMFWVGWVTLLTAKGTFAVGPFLLIKLVRVLIGLFLGLGK
jgi:hypothetical protein